MSKIEKALNRATSERQLTIVRSGGQAKETREPGAGQALAVASPSALQLEARARSSAAITLMREPSPLTKQELEAARIIFAEMGETPAVRAFREIRTKILQKTLGRNCVVMVTAVAAKSGTTFVALNLSAAFSFDEVKTALLMDCNLRSPRLHHLLKDQSASGLTDYLENPDMDAAAIIHPVGIERLRIVPAGGRRE